MSVAELSPSSQNYLKAIWSLQEWTDDPVTPTALAAKAGVRVSTVSDAVRKLTDQGLLKHTPYGSVGLTDEGRAFAVAMVRRHRLIETFLVQSLGYRWDQVHDEAEALEHAVSDFMIERIDELLGHPTRDPHGDPIPRANGDVDRPAAVVLTDVPAGTEARVERISDDDPALLQFFAEQQLGLGTVLTTRAGAPYSDAVEVVLHSSGTTITLGRSATNAVWVSAPESTVVRTS